MMDKGDEVWWINGAGDRLTGTARGRDMGRVTVFCHERQRLLYVRAVTLKPAEGGDHA